MIPVCYASVSGRQSGQIRTAKALLLAACVLVLPVEGCTQDDPVAEHPTFVTTSLAPAGPRLVLADSVLIPGTREEAEPGAIAVRLSVTPYAVSGTLGTERGDRTWTGEVMVYSVAPEQAGPDAAWHFACPWPSDARTRLLVDEPAHLAYFLTSHA